MISETIFYRVFSTNWEILNLLSTFQEALGSNVNNVNNINNNNNSNNNNNNNNNKINSNTEIEEVLGTCEGFVGQIISEIEEIDRGEQLPEIDLIDFRVWSMLWRWGKGEEGEVVL